MAMVKTLRLGEAFYLDDLRVEVIDIPGSGHVEVAVGEGGGDHRSVGVRGVWIGQAHVCVGAGTVRGHAKLLIDAPRSVRITGEVQG